MPLLQLNDHEQKINGRGVRTSIDSLPRIAKGLAEMSAFRMRLEIEHPDQALCGQRRHQERFFRSRISANTFQAGWPASPSDLARAGSSARRNGLAAFSAPIVAGMVGLAAGLSLATSSGRGTSA